MAIRHEVDLSTRDEIFNALVRESQAAAERVAFHLTATNQFRELSRTDLEIAHSTAQRLNRLMTFVRNRSRHTPEEAVVLLNAESLDTTYTLVYNRSNANA